MAESRRPTNPKTLENRRLRREVAKLREENAALRVSLRQVARRVTEHVAVLLVEHPPYPDPSKEDLR